MPPDAFWTRERAGARGRPDLEGVAGGGDVRGRRRQAEDLLTKRRGAVRAVDGGPRPRHARRADGDVRAVARRDLRQHEVARDEAGRLRDRDRVRTAAGVGRRRRRPRDDRGIDDVGQRQGRVVEVECERPAFATLLHCPVHPGGGDLVSMLVEDAGRCQPELGEEAAVTDEARRRRPRQPSERGRGLRAASAMSSVPGGGRP